MPIVKLLFSMLYLIDSGIHRLDLQGLISQACSEQSEFPEKKKMWRSVHSCHRAQLQADRVLSWDSVNVSSLSDCILMKVFYFSAERPNCNITR